MKRAFISWSGGKESTLALHYVRAAKWYDVKFLFVTIDRATQSVPVHAVPKRLITRQGLSLGIHTRKLYIDWPADNRTYEHMTLAEYRLMKTRGIEVCVFGDIHLADVRAFKEEICRKAGIEAVFPLWGKKSEDVVNDFLSLGYRAQICAVGHPDIPISEVGKDLNADWIKTLPHHIDPAGENGEYHTYVWDGPLFRYPVERLGAAYS